MNEVRIFSWIRIEALHEKIVELDIILRRPHVTIWFIINFFRL